MKDWKSIAFQECDPFSVGKDPFAASRLAQLVPTRTISAYPLPGTLKNWKKTVRGLFSELQKSGAVITNKDSAQQVHFNARSKGQVVSKMRKEPAHRAAMEAPSIVESSIYIGHSPENKGKGDHILGYDYFAIPLRIGTAERIAWFSTERHREELRNRAPFYQFGLLGESTKDGLPIQRPLEGNPSSESPSPTDEHSTSKPQRTIATFIEEVKTLHPASASFTIRPTSYSLGPSRLADLLRDDAAARIRNPEARAKALSRIARNLETLRLEAEQLELLIGSKRLRKSLQREAAVRQAMRLEELENAALARYSGIFGHQNLTIFSLMDESVKSQVLHAYRELIELGKFCRSMPIIPMRLLIRPLI